MHAQYSEAAAPGGTGTLLKGLNPEQHAAVTLPSGGKISLKGSSSVRGQSKSTKNPATLKFTIRAKGKALKKLRNAGTVKVKMTFAFIPRGGIASTKTKTIRLAMKKRR